ncbi:MAG: hypothetical protein JWM59_2459 [Verrucomicrobiales bacterium]|nr:hypothetical protein [Verrucomicrobiales bacterium]
MSAKRTSPAKGISAGKAYLARIRRKPAKSEHSLQSAIATWCRGIGFGYVRDRFAAIPNGGTRGADARSRAIAGAHLKAEGVRAGMPDLLFWKGGATVLWLEVKLGTSGTVSEAQHKVHASLREAGFQVLVARDLTEAIKAIINFYTEP